MVSIPADGCTPRPGPEVFDRAFSLAASSPGIARLDVGLTGVDFSPVAVDEARERLPMADLVRRVVVTVAPQEDQSPEV